MRDYEVVYIFKSALTSEEIEERLGRHHEKLLAGADSEITAVEHWGKRQLAYPIDRNDNGYYVVAQFTSEPDALPEFERALKLDDQLLRHLVVLSEGELPAPPSHREDQTAEEETGRKSNGPEDTATEKGEEE
jgi:small subunit ribosomal protein S6